jgi:hypothetical protein
MPSPIRRQGLFLQLLMRDTLKKLYPRASRLPKTTVPSLLALAAFAVGRYLESECDSLDDQAAFYDALPRHSHEYAAPR